VKDCRLFLDYIIQLWVILVGSQSLRMQGRAFVGRAQAIMNYTWWIWKVPMNNICTFVPEKAQLSSSCLRLIREWESLVRLKSQHTPWLMSNSIASNSSGAYDYPVRRSSHSKFVHKPRTLLLILKSLVSQGYSPFSAITLRKLSTTTVGFGLCLVPGTRLCRRSYSVVVLQGCPNGWVPSCLLRETLIVSIFRNIFWTANR
jgi:hypothetical protein